MIDITTFGQVVYRPAGTKPSDRSPTRDTRGPLGDWLKCGDPGYEEALEEQQRLESSWSDIRDEAGDG